MTRKILLLDHVVVGGACLEVRNLGVYEVHARCSVRTKFFIFNLVSDPLLGVEMGIIQLNHEGI
eukprot:snap_masked-scaffold_53-processed-gene-0.26-mRNA-1 protein AED:1.00 eAED:1.00 QI:0/0/0/0/1/1/2/0/63